jgi:outer membrane protein OmpA-like peptidoglycan-associated protein
MKRLAFILIPLILAGCQKRSALLLFPGDGEYPTGAVAILDPLTGDDVAVVDTANSEAKIAGRSVTTHVITGDIAKSRYGTLLANLPDAPKSFTLYFKPNSLDLIDQSQAELPALLAEVKRRAGVDVEVVGHTDTTGSEVLNDELSQKRAGEVATMFQKLGLDSTIIRAVGRGERELKEQTADETASEVNRRVEVVVR